MRCLYCGKELALLKRLTGGSEFCSEAHKQSYQEEYNRLAVSRLMQARAQKGEGKPAQPPPVQAAAAAAVAEPANEEAPVHKAAAPQPVAAKVSASPPEPPRPEPPVPASAGFSMEMPSVALAQPASTYVEPWLLEEAAVPSPAWHFESPSAKLLLFSLQLGDLLPLAVQAGVKDNQLPVAQTQLAAKEFGLPKINLSARLSVSRPHEFQQCGSIAVEIAPRPSETGSHASLHGAVDFAYTTVVQGFDLLAPMPAGIAFPEEDCDVTIPESWTNGIISDIPIDIDVPPRPVNGAIPQAPAETPAPASGDASPRAALEALSRLHQDMRERQEAVPPSLPEAEAAQPAVQPAPREANELVEISLKTFAPQKPSVAVSSSALIADGDPLFPRLKSLPLRPKVAPAPCTLDQQQKPAPAAAAPPVEKTKPSAPSAPAPAPAKAQPVQPAKTKPAAADAPVSKSAQPPPAAKTEKPPETAKTKPASLDPAKPVIPVQAVPPPAPQASKPAEPAKPDKPSAAKPEQAAKTQVKEKKTKPDEPPNVEKAPPAPRSPSVRQAAQTAPSSDTGVPNFGAVVNTSMFGSLKVKLGIAAIVVVISAGGYFMFAGKSAKPTVQGQVSTDGVGPSIMLGQGGWVEGWAGDPTGLHAERQITTYRPSLKLSDYRLEFEGQIETKSIGWVFRAADPQNYYAMKLVMASTELPLQVALYKYLVLKGRQVQVGRVPIDVPVKNDTVFKIRVDVRGPKFSTSVQGQPVDVWTDDQLKSGGVGFLNERGERGKIKSVSLFYLTGATK